MLSKVFLAWSGRSPREVPQGVPEQNWQSLRTLDTSPIRNSLRDFVRDFSRTCQEPLTKPRIHLTMSAGVCVRVMKMFSRKGGRDPELSFLSLIKHGTMKVRTWSII